MWNEAFGRGRIRWDSLWENKTREEHGKGLSTCACAKTTQQRNLPLAVYFHPEMTSTRSKLHYEGSWPFCSDPGLTCFIMIKRCVFQLDWEWRRSPCLGLLHQAAKWSSREETVWWWIDKIISAKIISLIFGAQHNQNLSSVCLGSFHTAVLAVMALAAHSLVEISVKAARFHQQPASAASISWTQAPTLICFTNNVKSNNREWALRVISLRIFYMLGCEEKRKLIVQRVGFNY